MKIQSLAVIFIIIVLPISMVLTTFVQSQVQTIQLQISYDTKLDNATYDALKAFQLNTINSGTSDETNSKLRDIEASVNAFFTSIASHFNITGYTQEDLQNYVPALVYTMYDGYYIYSKNTNTLTDKDYAPGTTYQDGEQIYSLKPYVPYSCRYIKDDIDVVINYSLDNYITVQGTANGNAINLSGYVMSPENITNVNKSEYFYNFVTYKGIQISGENILQEYIGAGGDADLYYFIKVNGSKYYKKDRDSTNSWVTFVNKDQYGSQPQFQVGVTDYSAPEYFGRSKEFMEQLNHYGILELTEGDAYDTSGTEKLVDAQNESDWDSDLTFDSSMTIFAPNANDDDGTLENTNSNFNQHRLKIIRYSIERNLSAAIANYNYHDGGITYDFRMPKLQEDEWDKILNHISIISFMQGLPIGGKIYNGYSIITNTKNKELVTEDSIYIIGGNDIVDNLANVANTNTARFYNVRSKDFISNTNSVTPTLGVLNIDFEPITQVLAGGTQETFFRRPQLADYGSVVTQTNLDYDETEDIYQYLDRVSQNGADAKRYGIGDSLLYCAWTRKAVYGQNCAGSKFSTRKCRSSG